MTVFLDTKRLLLVIILLGLFAMAMRPVTDPDVWWHLKTGELISRTHNVPRTDPFSFTRGGARWVDHEWLSDWLIFNAYRHLGLAGLNVIFAVLLTAALFIVYLRTPARPYLAGLFSIWGAVVSAPSWGVRPQMLSLLMASLFLWILERSERSPSFPLCLPPLMLLWVNLHAGYVLGIVLVALYLIGGILEAGCGFKKWAQVKRGLLLLLMALILCCVVVPINPNGFALIWYPFQTLRSHAMQTYIAEWFSPNFHQARFLPFLSMLLGVIVFAAVSPRRVRISSLLVLLATIWAALQSSRHIPIFVLAAVPLLAEWTEPLFLSLVSQTGRVRNKAALHVLNYGVLCAFLVFTVVRVRTVSRSLAQVEARNFPADGARFLQEHHLPQPLLNHYNWGGYLIWKLYPEYRVFIDGRADVYGDAFMNQFADIYYVKSAQWHSAIADNNIQTIMLPPDAPLVTALKLNKTWEERYHDQQAVILSRHQGSSPVSSSLP